MIEMKDNIKDGIQVQLRYILNGDYLLLSTPVAERPYRIPELAVLTMENMHMSGIHLYIMYLKLLDYNTFKKYGVESIRPRAIMFLPRVIDKYVRQLWGRPLWRLYDQSMGKAYEKFVEWRW